MEIFNILAPIILILIILAPIILILIFGGAGYYYRALCCKFRDRNVAQQKYIKFLKDEILKYKLKESALIKECKDWKLKATVPIFPNPDEPKIYTHTPDILESRIDLEQGRGAINFEIVKYKARESLLMKLQNYISERQEGQYYYFKVIIYKSDKNKSNE